MNEDVYQRLAKVLDTLPNGFPSTESGVEIGIFKKIFEPEQADLLCDLKLKFETAAQISQRTGRPPEGLEEMLLGMAERGQLFRVKLGETEIFKMVPWIFGIFEFQLAHIDRELAEMVEEYNPAFSKQFFSHTPQLMQTLTVEEAIPSNQEALPYEKVSTIIEKGKSFRVNECVCRKERGLLGNPCDRPSEVCLAIAPVPGYFEQFDEGRVISREEAYELLRDTEKSGDVHLTNNFQDGQIFICNCCKCCCGVLRTINETGMPASLAVNSHYYAKIDPEDCTSCGICAEERCQVSAIAEEEDAYMVVQDRCIGCGLCIDYCPSEAIKLVHKDRENLTPPPSTEKDWFEERGRLRGVDFSAYK